MCAAALLIGTAPAFAQLEEVVVTAQKREQSLQDVALAVSAFSGDMMNNAGVVNIEDITAMTPGFAISAYNPVTPAPYIRGVGTNSSSVGDDASVGVFIDEVYAGRAGGYRSDMYDVARVEVLRGPQGTLYGRNVAGGAMNIITNNPSEEFEAYVEGTYGDYDLLGFKGSLSGPLTDNGSVRARLAVASRQRDGHTDNVVTGSELRDEDNVSVRAKLAFDPSDRVSILLTGEYSEDDLAGPAARGFIGADDPTSDQQDVVSLVEDGFTERDMYGVSARVDVDWGPGTFTSITAYRNNDYSFLDDLTGTSALPLLNEASEESDQISQEFRYTASQDRWDYTLGVYYFNEDVDRVETFDSSGLVGIPGFSRPLWDASNESTSYAIFGEMTYRISEQLSVIAGGRFTDDEKEFSNTATNPDLFGFLLEEYQVDTDETWSEFTPKVTLQYQLDDDVMFYGTWSQGFKSGGFNGIAATEEEALQPFDPEQATNIEAGLKAELLDSRLRLNISAFYMDYEDLQNFFLSEGVVVTATADAEMSGIEVELWATLMDGLDINFSYGWLDTEYTEFPSNPDNEGNNLMRSPENSAAVGIQYSWPLGNWGSALVRGDYSYQDEVFFDVENTPVSAAEEYDLVHARLSLRHNSGFELAVWGKNLTDEEYFVHAFDLSGAGYAIYGDPRMWGVTASYAF
jgi:iron complex outermembrane receptor protein